MRNVSVLSAYSVSLYLELGLALTGGLIVINNQYQLCMLNIEPALCTMPRIYFPHIVGDIAGREPVQK